MFYMHLICSVYSTFVAKELKKELKVTEIDILYFKSFHRILRDRNKWYQSKILSNFHILKNIHFHSLFFFEKIRISCISPSIKIIILINVFFFYTISFYLFIVIIAFYEKDFISNFILLYVVLISFAFITSFILHI